MKNHVNIITVESMWGGRGRWRADPRNASTPYEFHLWFFLYVPKIHYCGILVPTAVHSTMSTFHTFDQGATARIKTPPIPVETLSLVHRIPGLDEHQLRRFFDSIIPDCDICNFYGAMIGAIGSNNMYLVKELLRNKMPMSPIHIVEATKPNAKDILTLFFENGWNINTPIDEINSPPMYACVHNAIYRESNTLKVVEMLIDQGASFNSLMYQDHQACQDMFPFMGETPLHTAVALKRGDVVRYLIRKGASVQTKDHKGETIL